MKDLKSNSKTKTTVKGKKTASAPKAEKTRRVSVTQSRLNDDEIRLKAQEIYNERITRGEHGTAEDDWLSAEKLLKG
jgi:hypothetical protein